MIDATNVDDTMKNEQTIIFNVNKSTTTNSYTCTCKSMNSSKSIYTQDNCISNKEQYAAAIWFFGPPAKRAKVTPTVTTTENLLQRTLFTVW